jgi:hypothetical protein
MLKRLLITTAVSGVIISGAIAQSQTPIAPTPKDQSTAPKAQSTANDSTSAPEAKFIPSQGADQWAFTKFRGTDVLGPDNASIGSVNDLLFDGTGKIIGVVIGVGGFLGIGTKPSTSYLRKPCKRRLAPWRQDLSLSSRAPAYRYRRSVGLYSG